MKNETKQEIKNELRINENKYISLVDKQINEYVKEYELSLFEYDITENKKICFVLEFSHKKRNIIKNIDNIDLQSLFMDILRKLKLSDNIKEYISFDYDKIEVFTKVTKEKIRYSLEVEL